MGVATVATVGAFTVRLKFVVLVIPPPVAVTVIVEVPAGVEVLVAIMRAVEQLGLQLFKEKDAADPVGRPDAENEVI